MKRFGLLFLLYCLTLRGLIAQPEGASATLAYTKALKQLTDVMVTDVTGPCGAARYYAYANLAAYELMYRQQKPAGYVPLAGLLRDYSLPAPKSTDPKIDVEFGTQYILLRMGEELLPSGYILEEHRNQLISDSRDKRHLSPALLDQTRAYADSLVKTLVRYAAKDGYVKTSGYVRYTPSDKPGSWQPTPPAYSEAYEPYWAVVRPFLLDSAAQFQPARPVAYSEEKDSDFYRLANEVYDTSRTLTADQRHIANFWDCNPFFLNQKGHVSFGTKKISPSGHWMGITSLVSVQQNLSLAETVRWHALVGLAMADAFISCWNEKYNSDRIRPETYINQHIDRTWRPMLQTPPFPEYTSGHSVMSQAVATVLTALAGEPIGYTDTIEVEFGVPARTYRSFTHAAREAAISRLYGGIHFRDSIDQGVWQGEQVGQFVLKKLGLSAKTTPAGKKSKRLGER
ncbi:vanadium-dependent haloperoxidase [Spirosoma sp. KUDC1026]|uniref:vanadium-dependent haloperoxidase n=1 Tax=Spirosoma sp. KUDC1026 TaxID=2745947 RepID=UPI00159BEC0A|nr:vanadium-dependent haloperoxidase [Spirosoma sp. KUDC1026]QKZ12135.1 vanadium-dependent haloperoxidase [Spirosoma sp. KUDC1026]